MKLYRYPMVLFIFVFFSMLFVGYSEAIPTCTFRSSCNAGETCVFKVFQNNDTHVGSCDSNYPTSVCCTEINAVAIRSSCNSDEGGIISMYATSNSHSGRKDYYSNVVCAKNSSSGNPMLATMRSSCLARENCVVSLYQENNTHVASCGYFGTKLCVQELFNVTITMLLNTTTPNLNDGVQLQGVATRADGTAIDTSSSSGTVIVYLNGTSTVCTTQTNSTGGYTCNFTAPSAIGPYELNVTINDTTTSKISSNKTTFSVKQSIGAPQSIETTAESIACYEEPRVVQNPDGTLEIAIVRICVFK